MYTLNEFSICKDACTCVYQNFCLKLVYIQYMANKNEIFTRNEQSQWNFVPSVSVWKGNYADLFLKLVHNCLQTWSDHIHNLKQKIMLYTDQFQNKIEWQNNVCQWSRTSSSDLVDVDYDNQFKTSILWMHDVTIKDCTLVTLSLS